jgi:hypothetical protein
MQLVSARNALVERLFAVLVGLQREIMNKFNTVTELVQRVKR